MCTFSGQKLCRARWTGNELESTHVRTSPFCPHSNVPEFDSVTADFDLAIHPTVEHRGADWQRRLVLPGSVASQRFIGASPEVLTSQQLARIAHKYFRPARIATRSVAGAA
jgi:hypothetical protein